MPIEIKELHIKATVVEKASGSVADDHDLRKEREAMKREITQECVREILQILEDKKER